MIGVIAQPAERAAVEEFFQLFKTPWEFVRPGRAYEVVLTVTDECPEVGAKLIVSYGSGPRSCEQSLRLTGGSQLENATLKYGGRKLPIYGSVRKFADASAVVLRVEATGESAGSKIVAQGQTKVRLGYDLFREVARLLSAGQPAERAAIPTAEMHIAILRDCILQAGIALVEIPPMPAGKDFVVCLTHDIDFFGIRNHWFDHTFFGFLGRATGGALVNFLRGKISVSRLVQNWLAVLKVPLVHLGLVEDFWLSFEWYLRVEKGLPATYFFIPFKGRAGEQVPVRGSSRRAAPYEVAEQTDWLSRLQNAGCEIGVHGLDAWHSAEKGRAELEKIVGLTRKSETGIRMHWLLQNENTPLVLDEAGYAYDSTAGYNETVGYRSGTVQVFRPLGARHLLELPLHIQDGALFYPGRLGLSETEAWERCQCLIDTAREFGGVLTLLWHDRSPGPERYWGDFYARLVKELRSQNLWFASADQAVSWFRKRREVVFERIEGSEQLRARRDGQESNSPRTYASASEETPPLLMRAHRPCGSGFETIDLPWAGEGEMNLSSFLTAVDSEELSTAPVALTA